MAEKSIRISDDASGFRLATRDAYALDGQSNARVIPLYDFAAGKFMSPVGPATRGLASWLAAADTFDLTAPPSELLNWLVDVGDGAVLTVAAEQTVSGGTAIVTPILFDAQSPPNVVGVLDPKTFIQTSAFRIGASAGQYELPVASWDVSGAHKVGLHLSGITGTSNGVRLFAWIDGVELSRLDPCYRHNVLLLPMNGVNNGTVFLDHSPVAAGMTVGGNAKTVTSDSKFGGSCVYFDGNGDFLSTPDGAHFNISGFDFTIEFWAKSLDKGGASAGIVCGQAANLGATAASWAIAINGTTLFFLASTGNSSWGIANISVTRAVTSAWAHYAFVRKGATLSIYEDGVLLGSGSIGTVSDCAQAFYIGDGTSNQSSIVGYLDDFRFTRNVARYTANFTPPTAAHPITERAGQDEHFWRVPLLLHCNGGDGGGAKTLDSSASPKAATFYGNAQIITRPGNGADGQCAYFDGSGDYLSCVASGDWQFGTGDFTIETWFHSLANTVGTGPVLFSCYTHPWSGTTNFFLNISTPSGTTPRLNFAAGNNVPVNMAGNDPVYTNVWHHAAVTRVSGVIRIFLDGKLQRNTHTNEVNIASSCALRIGANQDLSISQYFTGYMKDMRIIKGVGKYTSDFQPPVSLPTTEDPDWNSVKLQLPMTGSFGSTTFTDVSPAGRTVTRNGDTAIRVLTSKFGLSSLFMDGGYTTNGEHITVPKTSDFDWGWRQFTIEAWIYLLGNPTLDNTILSTCFTNSPWYSLRFRVNNSRGLYAGISTDSGSTLNHLISDTTTKIALNTWTHVAFVRDNDANKLRLFIDGVQAAELGSVSGQVYYATRDPVCIGVDPSSNGSPSLREYFRGFIQDLRVTIGAARYTEAFTPPTAPFPSYRE